MRWQPIETAPKDGQVVALFCPAWTATWSDRSTEYPATYCCAKWKGTQWGLDQPGDLAQSDEVFPEPTHWMPLPKPPERDEVA